MLIYLALAGFIGLLIGWLIGKLGRRRQANRIEANWRQTLADNDDEHRRLVQRFKKNNHILDEENNTLKTKIAALNSKIDANREEYERVKLASDKQTTQVADATAQLESSNARVAEEQSKNQKLQTLIKALKTASDEKEKKSRQLAVELETARSQVRTSSIESDSSFKALQAENAEMRGAIRENADLHQRVALEAREKEEALAELHAFKQRLANAERERDEYRQWTTTLEQEKAGTEERTQQAVEQALRASGSDVSDMEIELSRLRPMVTSMNAEINKLRDENQALAARQSTPPAGNDYSAHADLQAAVREVSYERDQLKLRSADYEQRIASLTSQLNGQAPSQDLNDLRRQLAEMSAEKGLMSAKIEELQDALGS
jgi:chromosome segregation ATPase